MKRARLCQQKGRERERERESEGGREGGREVGELVIYCSSSYI